MNLKDSFGNPLPRISANSVHPKVSCRECEVLFPQSRRDKQFCSNKCRYSWHSNRRRKAIVLAVERGEL